MALEYDTENKRALLGNDSSPVSENTENKRIITIYKGTDSEGNDTPYLKSTDVPGIFEVINSEDLPNILSESAVQSIKGISKDPSGNYYIDESLVG